MGDYDLSYEERKARLDNIQVSKELRNAAYQAAKKISDRFKRAEAKAWIGSRFRTAKDLHSFIDKLA